MPKIRRSGPEDRRTTNARASVPAAGVPHLRSYPIGILPDAPRAESESEPAVTPSHTPQRPALSDRKADWLAYAEAVLDEDPDDLAQLTKAELVEAVGE